MQDSNKIIDRLKIALNAKSDNELAKLLDINQSTIAGWRRLNNFDTNRVLDKYSNLNLNYLYYGIGEPYLEMKKEENKSENLFVKESKTEYIAKLENELKKTDAENGIVRKEIAQENIELEELKRRLTILEMLVVKGKNI